MKITTNVQTTGLDYYAVDNLVDVVKDLARADYAADIRLLCPRNGVYWVTIEGERAQVDHVVDLVESVIQREYPHWTTPEE